ncbi:FAD-binding domain-containing protein [Lentinus brumalis]|uniref:FAD-binding domain-containing protein n=1 Tax=Lentinus brumalis TaxID=2498619 RepID=A0A371DL39_9APHY|nr:FAD-binding domain-containing protein [Polyporus brumalis]
MSNFDTFKTSFKGDLLTPGDEGYESAIARWAKNAARKAAVVAFAKDAEDVSRAVTYARQAKLPIAIKGGGHNASGASSSEGGLVIDLSRYLNGVKVDTDKKLGYVGGGAIWETVDKTAIEQGLATVGGTVNHTGVGGLILGGGYGWLSGAYGLAIDNLVQATVVTADGSILTASESENSDLFWGIRGAGSNFGVITEFVLKLYPQRRTVYCGTIIYSPDMLGALLDVTEKWWHNGPSEKEGIIQVFTRGPGHQPCIVLFVFYNGSEEEGRANFKAFLDLKPIADMSKEQPYEVLNTLQNHIAGHGQNVYMKGCFAPQPFPRTLLPQVFDRVVELSAPEAYTFGLLFEYFPLGKINAVPDDATAYRRGLAPNVLCVVYAKEESEAAFNYSRDAAHELTGLVTGKKGEEIGYGNYSPDSEALPADGSVPASKAEANFGSNYKRLQEIKKKYDPELIFNKWFVITPAA